ncbi:MAG: hypothetical protein JWO36_356 [Myxococcales bacterium]|nr:hypothetical protein [Myxococcales bacterium]
MGHPNTRSRQGPPRTELARVLVFAPEPTRAAWIEEELAKEALTVQVTRTVEQTVAALIEDPPPRAQILIADFNAMSPADLLRLHAIREQGWFGTVIGLGTVSMAVRKSLNIDRVLSPPFVRNSLRNAVDGIGVLMATTRIPKIVR